MHVLRAFYKTAWLLRAISEKTKRGCVGTAVVRAPDQTSLARLFPPRKRRAGGVWSSFGENDNDKE